MIAEFTDEAEVQRYLTALRGKVADGTLGEQAQAASEAIGKDVLDAVPKTTDAQAPEQPFVSHDPAISLLQTSLEDEARKQDAVVVKKHGGPFAHIVATV